MRIEVEDLYFSYPSGVEALRGVRLEIESGQKVAIIGQNGSGKTTLVKHLNGLLRPTRGAVRIGDWVTTGRSVAQLAARVGYVFQNPDDQLFKGTVHDEIRFGPANLGWPGKQIESQVRAAANLLGLAGRLEINPYDLSPTWRKRVAMAAVLAMNTPIVVLDEPTTGQDYHSVQELAEILSTLHGQGKTIIAISHDIDFVAEHFARIVVMGAGQILLDGTPAEVFAQNELLAGTYVEPPQLTRLGARLGLGEVVYTADGFIEVIKKDVIG